MTGDEFREMALEFAGTETVPHFERVGFKVVKRRMFATYGEADNTANIFLSPEEQKTFCRIDKKNIFPVPNKWGEKGATTFTSIHPSFARPLHPPTPRSLVGSDQPYSRCPHRQVSLKDR